MYYKKRNDRDEICYCLMKPLQMRQMCLDLYIALIVVCARRRSRLNSITSYVWQLAIRQLEFYTAYIFSSLSLFLSLCSFYVMISKILFLNKRTNQNKKKGSIRLIDMLLFESAVAVAALVNHFCFFSLHSLPPRV